jgi:uncharacterized protein with von Willebrand factor type A (vWA) domain
LALAHRRSVDVILFGDAADPLHVVPLRPEDDARQRLEKVLDVASYFLGGGTDFEKPLSHVLDVISRSDAAEGHDVLFVSDGLCPLPDAFVRRFRGAKIRHDIRLTSVVIGGEPFSLAPISDAVHRLEESLEASDELAAEFATSFLERVPISTPRRGGRLEANRAQPLVFDHFLPGTDDG